MWMSYSKQNMLTKLCAFIPCWLELFHAETNLPEVNGLMHSPWITDVFSLIHLLLKTLQDGIIKAKAEDGRGNPLCMCMIEERCFSVLTVLDPGYYVEHTMVRSFSFDLKSPAEHFSTSKEMASSTYKEGEPASVNILPHTHTHTLKADTARQAKEAESGKV